MTQKHHVQTNATPVDYLEKREYHTPRFRKLGNVNALTLTNDPPPFSGNDGGSFPSNYGS